MDNDITIFFRNILNLVHTIVIKSTVNSTLLNDRIIGMYGKNAVDLNKPETWKYYLNLSGEYHYTDKMIYITSLDTLETIPFTKETLAVHNETRLNYKYGTRYYYRLVKKYPNHETLIKSILYPCDINDAINAPDGTILAYDTSYIEPQEQTLMMELNEWCKRYQARWKTNAFIHSDPLYPAASLGIMYLNMIPKIFNLRLKRCKTREAHSFHIKMYLASHSRLDEYLDYYTLKQKLWLYRNISYIEHNTGKKSNFNLLLNKILTERNIPLGEFTMNHVDEFDDKYYTSYSFDKTDLNHVISVPDKNIWSLDDIFEKENKLLPDNIEYNKFVYKDVDASLRNSPSAIVQTKVLESKMLDNRHSVPWTLEEIVMNYWPYMACKGLFNAVVNINEVIYDRAFSLNAKDAFIYYLILFCRYNDIPYTTISKWMSIHVLIEDVPSPKELYDVTFRADIDMQDAIDEYNNFPFLRKCNTISAFTRYMNEVYNSNYRQWFAEGKAGTMTRNGGIRNMGYRLHTDYVYPLLEKERDVDKWLDDHNIPNVHYEKNEAEFMMNQVFTTTTGVIEDELSKPANIQKALIETMKKLSSYSIQFVREINESDIVILNWSGVRVHRAVGGLGKLGDPIANSIISFLETRLLKLYYTLGYVPNSNNIWDIPNCKFIELINLIHVTGKPNNKTINIILPDLIRKIYKGNDNTHNVIIRSDVYCSNDKLDAEVGIANINKLRYISHNEIIKIPCIF